MTTATETISSEQESSLKDGLPSFDLKFEYMVTLAALWLVAGVHIDGWAHNNLPSSLETFFTPWHAILYTGFGALAAVLMFEMFKNVGMGYPIKNAMPEGYGLSIIGIIVFGLGGAGDGVWHTLLGIEETVDALYSPTHLLLAIGASLMFTGPIRNSWKHTETWNQRNFREKIPTIMTFSFFISILLFFYQYGNPLHSVLPALPFGDLSIESVSFYNEASGMMGIIIFTIILATMILKINTKLTLPFGSHIMMLGSITLFGMMMRFPIGADASGLEQLMRLFFVVLGLFTGLFIDLVNKRDLTKDQFSWFYTVGVPMYFFTGYMVIIALTLGSVYTIHLVLGIPFVAGLVGYLVKLSQIN